LVLHKRPDVVIADLMMPRLNCLELTRRTKQERPQTKILVMSAYTEETYRRIASVRGADGFVNKHLIHTSLLPASARSSSGRHQSCMNLRHPFLHPPDLPF
jgi:two-component system response regulator DesR